jgi:hypothetical protein
MANDGLLGLEEVVSAFAVGCWQGDEPQEIFSGEQFFIVPAFGGLDKVIEGFQGFGRWSFR